MSQCGSGDNYFSFLIIGVTEQKSVDSDCNTISQDLWEKSPPDGKMVHTVAGYLYFPKPPRKAKDATWELRYESADGKTRLTLPR